MIRTTFNPNENAYRQDELNYVKAHSASEESSEFDHLLRIYAIIQKNAGQADSTLENMLEKVHVCKDSDFGKFVQEHSASIVRKVQEQNAAEQNKKSDFMKHYRLVNRINGVELD